MSLSTYAASSLHFPILLLFIFLLCVLVETNRLPFDLYESESELVGGFLTEHGGIWFSCILLVEYASIVSILFFYVIVFNLHIGLVVTLLFLICLLRNTVNRLKYDELVSVA